MALNIEQLTEVAIDDGHQYVRIRAESADGEISIHLPLKLAVALSRSIADATAHSTKPILDHDTGQFTRSVNKVLKAQSLAFVLSNEGQVGLSVETEAGQLAPIMLPDGMLASLAEQFGTVLHLRSDHPSRSIRGRFKKMFGLFERER